MDIYDDPISQAILAESPINCPTCGEFISYFIHPDKDCGKAMEEDLTPNDQEGMV